jgi:23S rRNA C2498 (ribose-2'-O)-methylase RlmM
MDEIQREVSRRSSDVEKIVLHSPYPGLVRVDDPSDILSKYYDPVYALQKIPEAVVVQSDSTKGLAKAVYSALLGSENTSGDEETNNKASEDSRCHEVHALLRLAPRGSLAIHGLVPGMCKGQPNPVMLNRSQRVAAELSNMLRKGFAAARKQSDDKKESPQPIDIEDDDERWVLQVLLISPDVAVASLIKCTHIGPGKSFWPNWQTPMGMSQVDIIGKMPTSAYRKLMEAFECMRIRPEPFQSHAVDLGACPGGWTSVLRMLDCHVVSVDRSKLDPVLMNDDMVEFVKGDAFAFAPTATTSNNRPSTTEEGVAPEHTWMVSDVIAYPERVIELLERWCGGHWARYLIVTMKFQGDKPALDDLDHAIDVVERHGYHCRAKHFFNNKNEVTLMIHEKKRSMSIRPRQLDDGVLGSAMYKPILP